MSAPAATSIRTSLPPGTVVGRYTIVDRIGAGGMAELFLARQDGPRGFAKPIALKLLHAHVAEDPEFVAMFEREARVAAGLTHPNIVQVLDVGVAGGEHFLALEHVHGRDLRRVLAAQRGPLPLGCAIRIVVDIARALDYVHARTGPEGAPLHLVHRDVSPANVLVGFAGAVKLADFGIAKAADQTAHTRTGTFKGKFGYMAPEQYLQQAADARSDLYSLGVVLYEATTGRRAFGGKQTFSIMNRALAGEYAAPAEVVEDYPSALADLVARLLDTDPAGRPARAGPVADELEAIAEALELDVSVGALSAWMRTLFDDPAEPTLRVSSQSLPPSVVDLAPEERPTRPTRRARGFRPSMIAFAAIGVIGIGVGAIGGWRMARGEPGPVDEEAAPTPTPTPVEATPPVEPSAPVHASDDAVAPSPSPPENSAAAVEPTPPNVDAEVSGADGETPTASDATTRRRRKKPSRKPDARPAAAPTQTPAGMFPKAMQ